MVAIENMLSQSLSKAFLKKKQKEINAKYCQRNHSAMEEDEKMERLCLAMNKFQADEKITDMSNYIPLFLGFSDSLLYELTA